MPEPTLDSILADIREEKSADPYAFSSSRRSHLPTTIPTGQVQDVKYNVHTDAIYDRLSDGSYIPKFENYKGATGNENRLAQEQGVFEQIAYGTGKFFAKVGTYALDATVGTVYGIFNAIEKGEFEGLYDNDFSHTMDDWNKQLDNSLPNYYTDEQKSMSVLRSMGTFNFWFNDVAGGLAFVGGALLPEIGIAAATGGASLPSSFAKIGLKTGTKSFLKAGKKGVKEAFDQGVKESTRQTGLNLLRGQRFAKIGEYTGEALKTGGFLARTSNFEAGMEARHNLNQAVSEYLMTFEELNGRSPTFEEYSTFMEEATSASNLVYGSNLAILALSNLAMFGSKFGVGVKMGKKLTNFGNKAIGLGVKKTAGKEATLAGANRFQKFLGNTYLTLGKASVEGIYEEGLQGVAGTTMQNYLKAKYDPDVEEGYGLWSSMVDAFGHQYGTKEGWKEMAIGMIIGFGAGGIQGQGLQGIGKNSRKKREKRVQEQVNVANKGQEILRNMDRANAMANFRNLSESQSANNESTEISNTVINTDFIKTQEHLKTSGEIVRDFNAVVDNMEITQEQIDDLGGTEAVEQYKNSLKVEFAEDAKNYRAAKSLVKSIGLSGKIDITEGNTVELGEAITMNMMVGKTSLRKAKTIAKQIDDLVGTEGAFNHLEHYNNLSQDKKRAVEDIKKKKRRLRDLEKLAKQYGQRVEGIDIQGRRQLKEDTLLRNYHKFSEKLVTTQSKISELQDEIVALTESLDLGFRAENMDLEGAVATDTTFHTAEQMLEEVDKIDTYIASLRAIDKNVEADALEHLVTEYKMYSDAHRQMNSDFRRMFDTKFFKGKGKGFLKGVLGPKYKMSDEFRESLKENDELIDRALRNTGLKGYTDVESLVQELLEENEEISDREKFRRESLIRTILGAKRIQNRLDDIQNTAEIVSSVEQRSSDPLVGDTVRLKKMINPEGKDLSNLDVLNEVIDDIVEEIDSLRNLKGDKELIENAEKRLEELKQTEVEEEVNEGDHEKVRGTIGMSEDDITDEQDTLRDTYQNFLKKEIEINKLNVEIADLKSAKEFKIATTEEYRKLLDLSEKRREGIISAEEILELDEVSKSIDEWIMITGTVVEGLRLSDLLRQKFALENTEITKVDNIEEVTIQDKIDQIDISDKTGSVNYSYGQTFEGVTAINTPEGIEISGINPEAFETLSGQSAYKVNRQGNIVITPETQASINAGGKLSILPTNKELTTNYSIVLITNTDIEGETITEPLISTFNEDFNGEQNPDEIYNQAVGDNLILEVNPNDAYNKELLDRYRKATGQSTSIEVTEEALEEELSEDTKYQDLLFDIEVLEEDERKATTLKKAGVTKKLLRKREALEKRRVTIEDKLVRAADRSKTKVSSKEQDAIMEELRRALVIRVKDSEGNFIAVLKAKRGTAIKSVESENFESLRDQVVSDIEFLNRLAETGVSEELDDVGTVVVKKVLLGHPNFNFTKAEDGSLSIESREIKEDDLQHITDIGYAEGGKLITKSKDTGINTTFISKSIKNEEGGKTPFVVVTKGNQKVAYPVRAVPREKSSLDEFRDIYNSRLSLPEKAIALNTYMAEKGIDIKLPGNSFIGIHKNNINDEFFNEKLSQLEAINYFQDFESWSDPNVSVAVNLVGQAMIDIKLNNPFHSPKIQMDFTELSVEPSPVRVTEKVKTKTKKSTMNTGSGVSSFLHKCK